MPTSAKHSTNKMTCKNIKVGMDVCRLEFTEGMTVDTETFLTARGEMMILRKNSDGKVFEIELVADFKPCQTGIIQQKLV